MTLKLMSTLTIVINYDEDDDSTVDNNASDFMERISKDVTAAHQVTLLFQDYDERRPKATETTCVLINLFNFLAASAGDSVRIGVTSDLKAVYGRAEDQLFLSKASIGAQTKWATIQK